MLVGLVGKDRCMLLLVLLHTVRLVAVGRGTKVAVLRRHCQAVLVAGLSARRHAS